MIVESLRSPQPAWELRGGVRTLRARGYDREALVEDLLRLQTHLQETGQDRDEDVLLGVMDSLAGWCAPGWRL